MRIALVLGSIALSLSTVLAARPSAPEMPPYTRAGSFSADVVTRVDDLGRYVVLVDTDRDGTVEHAIVYEARSPLPPAAARFEADVRLTYSGDRGPRRVGIVRRRGANIEPIVRIDLDAPREQGARTSESVLGGGIALVEVSGFALWPDSATVPAESLVRRGLPTFGQAETAHVRTSRRREDPAIDPVTEACKCKDCSSGGPGARTCTVKCAGKIVVVDFGEDCTVECGDGYYACCACKGLFGSFGSCECVAN